MEEDEAVKAVVSKAVNKVRSELAAEHELSLSIMRIEMQTAAESMKRDFQASVEKHILGKARGLERKPDHTYNAEEEVDKDETNMSAPEDNTDDAVDANNLRSSNALLMNSL